MRKESKEFLTKVLKIESWMQVRLYLLNGDTLSRLLYLMGVPITKIVNFIGSCICRLDGHKIEVISGAFEGLIYIGNKTVEWNRLSKVLNWIEENEAYWVFMGDACDAIMPHPMEKRLDLDELDPNFYTPKLQYQKFYELLEPIKKQGLMILAGNHDDTLRRRHYHDYVDEKAHMIGVPYACGLSGFLRLVFKRIKSKRRFDVYCHHGYSTARTKGAKINRVEDMADMFEADIYVMGHVHEIIHTAKTVMTVKNNLVEEEKVTHFLLSGGFIRGYVDKHQTYIERKMLKPTRLGSIGVEITPEHREIQIVEIT